MAGGGAQPKAPDYVGQAREQGRQNILAAQEQARLGRTGSSGPYGTSSWSGNDKDGFTNTTTLAPGQQQLLDSSTANASAGNKLAGEALTKYGAQAGQGINTSGYNPRTTSVAPSSYQKNVAAPNVQGSIDTNNLTAIPGASDFGGERQQVQDALYRQSTNVLDPQMQQREEALRTRLINSGVQEGSEGFKNSFDTFGRDRTAAYGDARDRAILGGGAEQSRLFNDSLAARGQQFGERTTEGNFTNAAEDQKLQSELARLGFFNDASSNEFNQGLANAGLGNSQRDAQFGEDSANHQMSMQELMQLIGMNQGPQLPGGSGSGGGQAIDPVDITGATSSQYQAMLNQYNNDQATRNTNVGAGVGIASAALIAY